MISNTDLPFPESENKYEALARKLNTQETEGIKSNERAENVEVVL